MTDLQTSHPISASRHSPKAPPTQAIPINTIDDVSKGYSSVNKLSLLPDEVRTAENLEGDTVPADKEVELLEQYRKEREDYEEKQLQRLAEAKAKKGAVAIPGMVGGTNLPAPPISVVLQGTPLDPNYEMVDPASPVAPVTVRGAVGPYEDPPDAASRSQAKKTGTLQDTHLLDYNGYESVDPVAPVSVRSAIGPYEDPPDAVSRSQAKKTGTFQDTNLLDCNGHESVDPVSSVSKSGTYKNPADAVSGKIGSKGKKTVQEKLSVAASSPGEEYTPVFNSLPEGQVERVVQTKTVGKILSNPSQGTSQGSHSYENSDSSPTRRVSAEYSPEHAKANSKLTGGQDGNRASKRKPAKEVVEFDPSKPKKFTMSSSTKRKSGGKQEGDATDGDLDDSPSRSNGDSGKGLTNPDASPMVDLGIGEMSYALVNLVDKKKNRVESDVSKCEGSGVPKHYRVPVMT